MAKKEISFLHWILDLLPEEVQNKAFFGGRSFYSGEKIVLAVFENPGDRQYKDFKADYDIWCGCLFPVDREKQAEVLKKYPDLTVHPVLQKWLYLPSSHEDFEEITTKILKQIARGSELFGTIPNQKKSKNSKVSVKDKAIHTKSVKSKKKPVKIEKVAAKDMRKPRMFSEGPKPIDWDQVKNISDLKNLGPTSEVSFRKAGIKSAREFFKLGWKKAMVKLVKINKKHRHSLYAYAMIAALKNQDWSELSEEDKKEARDFVKSMKK